MQQTEGAPDVGRPEPAPHRSLRPIRRGQGTSSSHASANCTRMSSSPSPPRHERYAPASSMASITTSSRRRNSQRSWRGDELLEHAEVYGNHYGVPREQVRNALAEGRHAFVRVDIQGAASIRAIAPDALLFFIAPPSFEELERRLRSRHTESAEQMAVRIETAKEEMEAAAWFDAVVVNETDAIDATVAEIMRIVEAQQHRTPRRIVRV